MASCCPMPKRYQIACMIGLGFLTTCGMRCNLGVAVVVMTRTSAHLTSERNVSLGNESYNVEPPAFNWTPDIIGTVESSYFLGSLIAQLPAGYFASKFPANRLFGLAVVISCVLNLFIPASAMLHYGVVIAVRVLQGFSEGMLFPVCSGIWRYWAPPGERSRLATIGYTGCYASAVIGMPLSGVLADQVHWGVPFYVYGGMGILWFIAWSVISSESPATSSSISEQERTYIEDSIGLISVSSQIKTPWAAIFRSLPVWAIVVANFCHLWTVYLVIIEQPAYFKDVLGHTVGEYGLLATLPHFMVLMMVPIGGVLADGLIKRKFSVTTVRKIFNCGGFSLEAIFLMALVFITDSGGEIAALTLAVGFSGLGVSGFNVNHLDISPRHASILMGISNTAGVIAAMTVPIFVAEQTAHHTRKEWSTIFLVSSLLHFAGVTFYALFASGEKQQWAETTEILVNQ